MAVCKVGRLLGREHILNQPDRALLRQWNDTGLDARGRRVPASAMSAALHLVGERVSPTTLKDHRGHRCACWKDN